MHTPGQSTVTGRDDGDGSAQPAQPSRSAARAAGIVMLLTLVAGAASIVSSITTGRIELNPATWTLKGILSGESAVHLADEIADTPFPNALADGERAASWLITGSLGPRVRRGCDPWLFLVDELSVHPHAQKNAALRLETVAKVRDQLKHKGIELVVATVPDKSRVQHEQLCGLYRPPSSEDRLAQWEAGLSALGIHQTSLLPALDALALAEPEQAFLKTDTHWTQAGAHASAQEIARTVDRLNLDLSPRQTYALTMAPPEPREGDLVRLAGIDWLPRSLLPTPDIVQPLTIEPAPGSSSGDATPSAPQVQGKDDAAQDLFGDANLPSAALIGTSFSRTSHFAPFLEMALQTPVPSFAVDGGDFWGSASKYLSSEEFRDTPPKVVFWEIPERVLQMPISADEQAWMNTLPGNP